MTTPAFRTSARFDRVDASPIRSIMAVASQPHIISFAGGIPDGALFPHEEMRESFDWVMTHQYARALQYASTPGEVELRVLAADRLSRWLPTDPVHIQTTVGSQEGISLAASAMLDPGDVVLVEEPTYLAAVQSFLLAGARLVGLPTDDDGIVPDALERALAVHRPKLLYLVPNFQNPTGRCLSLARRQAIAERLLNSDTLLVEDDPYGDLRFAGTPIPPISSLPGMGERSLLLNSMSKVLAPGVRIGWMRGEGDLMHTIEVAKQAAGLQSPVTDQLAVAHYLTHNDLDEHIRRVSAAYAPRRDAMVDALTDLWPDASITRPEGGMFCWVRLGGSTDTQSLFHAAIDEGVAFVPGWSFYAGTPDRTTLRLSFATNDPDTIREGVDRLARAAHLTPAYGVPPA